MRGFALGVYDRPNNHVLWSKLPDTSQAALVVCFLKPSQPRLTLVAMLDWSQGHAAMSHDGLDAENMLVNPGGITAHHNKATRTPQPPVTYNVMPSGRRIPVYSKPWPKRAPKCHLCSKKSPADTCSCREANDEASRRGINNSDFQKCHMFVEIYF